MRQSHKFEPYAMVQACSVDLNCTLKIHAEDLFIQFLFEVFPAFSVTE